MKPWKRQASHMLPTAWRTCFNGATAMKPWKSLLTDEYQCDLHRASMGPRRWSRGRGVVTPSWSLSGEIRFNGATAMKPWKRHSTARQHSPYHSGFNGATAMKPWKSTVPESPFRLPDVLQWGHGDEAVEENEPESATRTWRYELQWGHGDEAVEEPSVHAAVRAADAELQWGHGDEAVEEPSAIAVAHQVHGRASMGPRR